MVTSAAPGASAESAKADAGEHGGEAGANGGKPAGTTDKGRRPDKIDGRETSQDQGNRKRGRSERVGAPTGGRNDWNLVASYCFQMRKAGRARPPLSDLVKYLAQHSERARKLCQEIRDRVWPSGAGRDEVGGPGPDAESPIAAEQQEDEPPKLKKARKEMDEAEDLQTVRIDMLLRGDLDETELSRKDYRAVRRASARFAIKQGQLRYVGPKRDQCRRVLFSPSEVSEAVRMAHQEAGHFKRDPTMDLLNKTVWWRRGSVKDAVSRHLSRECVVCKFHDPAATKVVPEMQHVAYRPTVFSLLAMDIKTLPKSSEGYNNLLLVVDYFSKYCFGAPLRDATAPSVFDALMNNIFRIHGCPDMMLSDNAKSFKESVATRVLQTFGVGQRFISPYHPQSNGLCERMNGVISTVVAKLVAGVLSAWEEALPMALYHYNTKRSCATKMAPYHVVYGREPKSWVPRRLSERARESGPGGDEDLFVESMSEDEERRQLGKWDGCRSLLKAAVVGNQGKQNRKNKKAYDKRNKVEEHKFKIGDKVLKTDLQKSRLMNGRLMPRYAGPFTISGMTKTTVRLTCSDGKIIKGVKFHLIKAFTGRSDSPPGSE